MPLYGPVLKGSFFLLTCAVYGELKYLPVGEKYSLNPISPYAESKIHAERACIEFQESYGLKITVFRPFNLYGLRQRKEGCASVISIFINRLRSGKRV